jgi:hypothetical protein
METHLFDRWRRMRCSEEVLVDLGGWWTTNNAQTTAAAITMPTSSPADGRRDDNPNENISIALFCDSKWYATTRAAPTAEYAPPAAADAAAPVGCGLEQDI